MPVRDFVRGSNGSRPSPENGGGIEGQAQSRNARKLAAEMARVTVPPIRTGIPRHFTAAKSQSGFAAQQELEGEGDMFDTDLEGIDDTTTITGSMIEDGVAVMSMRPQPRQDQQMGNLPDGGTPQESYAERITRKFEEQQREEERKQQEQQHLELQQQEDYDMQFQQSGNQEPDFFENPEDEQVFDWEDTMELDRHPRSWQQIEAALRQGPHSPQPRSPQAVQHQQQHVSEPPMPEQDTRAFVRPKTSHVFARPNPRTRLANSRFSTPNLPAPPLTAMPGNVAGPRNTLARPASVAGRPVSPQPMSARPEEGMAFGLEHRDDGNRARFAKPNIDGAGGRGGIFDTTNLSAVDDSESSDHQTAYTSVRLSTLSPASSTKRRPSDNYEADYPPNILRSKTFADLENESFDYNPNPIQAVFPPQTPPLSLHEQLDRLRSLTEGQRRTFFSGLTLSEWEESGDWLIEQFGELLKKTKDARRERRKVAMVFEKEIARRYTAVDADSQMIKRRMNDMRNGGMGVLRGHQGL